MPQKKSRSKNVNASQKKSNDKKKKPKPFRQTGGIVGNAIGSVFGNPTLGKSLGKWLGTGIGTIFGSGSYELKENSLVSGTGSQVPFVHGTSESIRFRHREFITDIQGSTTFTKVNYPVNPGFSGSFPFLSSIAENFTEYHFSGLCYEFKSTSADALNSTNTALGTVAIAAQYRADTDLLTTKNDVLNHFWSVDTKPSESVILPIECAPSESPMKHLYVRTAPTQANQDVKFYDLCKVTVATFGMQAVATIGELWVTYDIELRKPVSLGGKGIGMGSYVATGFSNATYPFGTSRTAYYDNMFPTFVGTVMTFPAPYRPMSGEFSFTTYGAGSTFGGTPVTVLTNCTAVSVLYYSMQTTGFTCWQNIVVTDPSKPFSIDLHGFTQAVDAVANYSFQQTNPGIVGS